ncbi:uncharacterized protein [Diabrotica undecimpunctata]|uniref:uncharacterized protein isoform X4 n=1 Tax=Diabrotica undecimpunctata TaxID=50387 RepID=UPI003B6374BD
MELSVGFKDSLNHLVLTCSEDKDFLKQDVKLEVEEHTLENKYTEEPLLAESYTENITNITLENHSVKDETSKTSYIIAIQNVKVEIKEELEESNVNHSQNKFKKTNIKKLETNSSNEVNRNSHPQKKIIQIKEQYMRQDYEEKCHHDFTRGFYLPERTFQKRSNRCGNTRLPLPL